MKTVLWLAAAGIGAAVLYRLYQASRFNVPFVRALQNPTVPINALTVPGRADGVGTLLEISAHPQTRSGRGAF